MAIPRAEKLLYEHRGHLRPRTAQNRSICARPRRLGRLTGQHHFYLVIAKQKFMPRPAPLSLFRLKRKPRMEKQARSLHRRRLRLLSATTAQ